MLPHDQNTRLRRDRLLFRELKRAFRNHSDDGPESSWTHPGCFDDVRDQDASTEVMHRIKDRFINLGIRSANGVEELGVMELDRIYIALTDHSHLIAKLANRMNCNLGDFIKNTSTLKPLGMLNRNRDASTVLLVDQKVEEVDSLLSGTITPIAGHLFMDLGDISVSIKDQCDLALKITFENNNSARVVAHNEMTTKASFRPESWPALGT